MTKRVMLVDGYQAKPKPNESMTQRGLQASGTTGAKPPSGDQLPQAQQSTVKPPSRD